MLDKICISIYIKQERSHRKKIDRKKKNVGEFCLWVPFKSSNDACFTFPNQIWSRGIAAYENKGFPHFQ